MTKEEAKTEIEKVFEPAFANYIIKALTDGATESDVEPQDSADRERVIALRVNNKTCVQCKHYECFDKKEFPCIDCMLDCKDRFEPKPVEPQGFEDYLNQYLGENDQMIIGKDVYEELKYEKDRLEAFMRGLYEECFLGEETYTSKEVYNMINKEVFEIEDKGE